MQEETTNNVGKKLKISFLLNAILLLALAVLYVLFFTERKAPGGVDSKQGVISGSEVRVGYVDSDSILTHYTLAIEKSKELEIKGKNLETQLKSRQDQYEKDAAYFQDQVSQNKLSEQSAQYIYNQLMEEQQKIYEMQNQFAAELADLEQQVNLMLLDSVTNFLERYNRVLNFDYILGDNPGSNLLLKNPKYNITDQVIQGLNHEYTPTQE
ncbi:MAG: OmpH family outer membrane protein [Bacteroidales bacterium]|nr:OmpH family outer membrane protein [Lentimicrobiaceae bacterium]MDD5693705.1 OmpH family outer membrane protein [Bacteroidales bacterium]